MIELALASILSCADGAWILEGLGRSRGMTQLQKFEVYREIRAVMPLECDLSQFHETGKFQSEPIKFD